VIRAVDAVAASPTPSITNRFSVAAVVAALEYATAGLFVFPTNPADKRPYGGTHGHLDATRATEQIEQWWTRWPKAMVAVSTGASGLVVVDVDGEVGRESWAALLAEHPTDCSTAIRTPGTAAQNRGPGLHVWFRADPDPAHRIGNTTSELGAKIDTRGDGGYAVLPPSERELDGPYTWASEPFRSVAELPVVPAWIVERLAKPKQQHDKVPVVELPPPVDPATYSRYAKAAERGEIALVEAAAEGSREKTLNNAALALGGLVMAERLADRLDYATTRQRLIEAALATGLGLAEVVKKVDHGIGDGMQQPRKSTTLTTTAGHDWGKPIFDTDADAEAGRYLDWRLLWDDDFPESEWLVEPLIETGQAVSLYSPAKTGKSLLALELAGALAVGRPVLGNAAKEPTNVLYIDHENTRADIRDRLADMGYDADADLSRLHYSLLADWPPLDTEAGGDRLHAEADRLGARLVILDTVSRAISGEENSSDTFIRLYRHTIRPLNADGVAFIRLDHLGKDRTKGALAHRPRAMTWMPPGCSWRPGRRC